jgi:hypothetical protein
VNRINRLSQRDRSGDRARIDPMQKVHFEAPQNPSGRVVTHVALLPAYLNAKGSVSRRPSVVEFEADTRKVLRLDTGRSSGRLPPG